LLFYEPDANLFLGVEEQETEGFVDYDNVPPWGTWIAYIFEPDRNYLLSWVPPELLPLLTRGIAVSDRSIGWLDDTDLIIAAELRQNGLF